MKKFFEEPKVCLEQFSVTDQTLTVSWVIPGENETNPISAISGNAISGNAID